MERYLLRREIARFFTKNEEVRRIVVGSKVSISITKQNGGYVICNETGAHFTHDYRKTEAMINAFLRKHVEWFPIAVTSSSGAIRLINLLEFAAK
jgi:hypothetical protein